MLQNDTGRTGYWEVSCSFHHAKGVTVTEHRFSRTLVGALAYSELSTVSVCCAHLATFLIAYNFAKRLKTLKGLTSYEYICQQWQKQPQRFLSDPSHLTLGLYT